jgi:signal transduction histidine kinase
VALAELADQVVSVVGGLPDYRGRKLVVAVVPMRNGTDVSTERSELTVLAVEAEMKQVLLNLTLNSLEATAPEGGIVKIELSRDDGQVEVAVSDNGRGMSPQTLERVFEPFFTEKRGTQAAGTGLGLSITHRIVEVHGGTIRAYSDGPGYGSRFVIRLPALVAQEIRA